MARAKYGRGAQVCPACNKKTAFEVTVPFDDRSPLVRVDRCNKCGVTSHRGEVMRERGKPLVLEVALKAIKAHQARELSVAKACAERVSELDELAQRLEGDRVWPEAKCTCGLEPYDPADGHFAYCAVMQ